MEFRILGPLEVAEGERPITLDAGKHRTLLSVLLLHANEVVSAERLIDELWGERPPATAPKLVQTYVSQLRRTLGAEAIATRAPGYLLQVAEERIDAARFRTRSAEARRLAARGEHERASAVYEQALELWRGPALADVAFDSFARNEVARLEEERVAAVTERIDAELALGRHEELVGELEALVEQHPLRERLRAQLMLTLYRSGRQADALAAYRDARRTLVEELGLEPGPELQALEKAILAHDPAVQAPPRRPRRAEARRRRAPVAAIVAALVLAVAVAVGVGLAGGGEEPESLRLAPNSVGFIDAESTRVTRSFPVGREPRSLALAFDSVWVANYAEKTVTRIDRDSGRRVTIPVNSHPTGIGAHEGLVWASTLEGLLVPIDPRFDSVGTPIELVALTRGSETLGDVVSGAGFLWVTAPPIMVVRVDTSEPREVVPIVPDAGAAGAIEVRDSDAWVAGSGEVFPIEAEAGVPTQGIGVGTPVRDLTFASGSLWVVSGGPARARTRVGLRRVDLGTRLIETTIGVGSDPIAVSAGGGSLWVASRSDGSVSRVDPATNDVVDTIALGARPTALAADESGVWVAVE